MCSDNKNSNVASFGLGAVLGAGAGVFLSTKKGRKMVRKVWKQIEPYIDDAVDTAKDEFEEVKDRAQEIKAKADDFKDQAEVDVARTISQVKDFANEKIPPSLKKTVKRTFFKGV